MPFAVMFVTWKYMHQLGSRDLFEGGGGRVGAKAKHFKAYTSAQLRWRESQVLALEFLYIEKWRV